MKKLMVFLFLTLLVGLGIWAFIEGRKEMQKEREREKPVQTEPRTKKEPDGTSVVELEPETLKLSGIVIERVRGLLKQDAIVVADGSVYYFTELRPGVFARKICASGACIAADEKVVIHGAQVLLSEERKGIIRIGEEGGRD